MSGKQRQGPQPAPRRELGPADGRQTPAPGNPARPAQSHISGSRDAGSQISQGHPVAPGRELDGAGPHTTMNYHPGMPSAGVTLTMRAAHPENPGNQTASGGVPSLRLEIQDNARAAVAPGYGNPSDFAQPPGAMGLAGGEYQHDYHLSPSEPGGTPLVTPQPPGGPAGHVLRREPGELQAGGRPANRQAPGWAYSNTAPGDSGPFA
jgi:hypothetical protein